MHSSTRVLQRAAFQNFHDHVIDTVNETCKVETEGCNLAKLWGTALGMLVQGIEGTPGTHSLIVPRTLYRFIPQR